MLWLLIRMGQEGANVFAGGYDGIFRSINSGSNWTQSGLINTFVSSFTITPNGVAGNYIFAATPSGVFRSGDDGANWVGVNNGLYNLSDVNVLASSPNGTGGSIFS